MAKIGDNLLLELLGSELSLRNEVSLQSGEDPEEVGNNMDFGGELWCTSES